jgi:Mn2+/Fe2+ NRAMP family transporter
LAAQFANGLLLPIIAIFLLVVMNQKKQLGQYVNKWLGNTLGVIVVIVTAGLGIRLIMSATGVL